MKSVITGSVIPFLIMVSFLYHRYQCEYVPLLYAAYVVNSMACLKSLQFYVSQYDKS